MDRPRILLDDDGLIAVNKPGGWLVEREGPGRSLLGWVKEREASMGGQAEEIRLCHRLDKDTSGVIVLARGRERAAAIGAAFSERRVFKAYLALTWPIPPVRWKKVSQVLKPRRIPNGERMEIVESGGLQADSEVELLARGRRYGFVRVLPEQGRKHHVRVALASMGAPILGDFLYGGRQTAKRAPRVMLHSRMLELAHPGSGEHLRLLAPVPADLRELLDADGGQLPSQLDKRHREAPKGRRRRR